MQAPLFDLHCDTILKVKVFGKKLAQDGVGMHVDIPKMRRGDVSGEVFALWVDSAILNGQQAFKQTEKLLILCKANDTYAYKKPSVGRFCKRQWSKDRKM